MTSLIIPVFNESEHLPDLLERISLLPIAGELEIIVVDDSPDDLTFKSAEPWLDKLNLRIIRRKKRLGLSSAVIDGFKEASSKILVCMDGDGSHPPEKIEELRNRIKSGKDMVVASRYVPGGGASNSWSIVRKSISLICTLMVRPVTGIKDPMSGFFAVSSSYFEKVLPLLKPLSYKIALELAVKGNLWKVDEVPFKFEERKAGSSKVTAGVVFGMIYHFFLLYCWKFFKRKV